MTKRKDNDLKLVALKDGGTLNSRPELVTDELYLQHEFFDARDLLQVKSEMLRRARVEGLPVVQAARTFGFSRPSFYQARQAFEQEGLGGLLPAKKGPRHAHKLSEEVMAFVARILREDPSLNARELVPAIEEEFGISVHQRSIERALKRAEKKTP